MWKNEPNLTGIREDVSLLKERGYEIECLLGGLGNKANSETAAEPEAAFAGTRCPSKQKKQAGRRSR